MEGGGKGRNEAERVSWETRDRKEIQEEVET